MATLRTRDREYNTLMLVDTGADNILLPSEAVEHLSLSPDAFTQTSISTVYGNRDAYVGPEIDLTFADFRDDISFRVSPMFTPLANVAGYGILGRDDKVLKHVKYCFTHRREHAFLLSFLDASDSTAPGK